MRIRTHSAEETRALARETAAVLEPGDVVVLSGDLGGGKTVFVQGACAGLGVVEPVTSPTFAIVQEYVGRFRVVHVDVYRLDTVQELHDLGFEEIIDDEQITFVEWGERASRLLPADILVVTIGLPPGDDVAPDERIVHLEVRGPRWGPRARRLATALAHYLHPDVGQD